MPRKKELEQGSPGLGKHLHPAFFRLHLLQKLPAGKLPGNGRVVKLFGSF